MAKKKSTVNKAGNYTKPGMRKKIFQRIKAGSKGGAPGQWSARKAQLVAVAYKKAGGGYKQESNMPMHYKDKNGMKKKANGVKKNGMKKNGNGLSAAQKKLPPALQKAIAAKKKKK